MPDYQISLSPEKVRQIAAERRQFSIPASQYINRAWEIVTGDVGPFFAFVLLSGMASFLLGIIPYLGDVLSSLLSAVLAPGYAVYTFNKRKNGQSEFSDFFAGFQHAGPLIVTSILMGLAFAVVALPIIVTSLMLDKGSDPSGILIILIMVFALIALVGVVYLAIVFAFAPYLVVFAGMSPTEALSSSYQIGSANFGGLFGMIVMAILIIILGMLACLLGLLVAIPVVSVAYYLLFEDIFAPGGEGGDELDDVLQHLV